MWTSNSKADTVMPQEIDDWLTVNTKTPATSNRYRALFSLIYVRPYGMETQANLEVKTGAAIRAAGSPAAPKSIIEHHAISFLFQSFL